MGTLTMWSPSFILAGLLVLTTCVAGDGICTDGYFMCADGTCIPDAFVCDGVTDCANTADDEKNCKAKSAPGDGICTDGFFMCADGTCIPDAFVCDGVTDCANTADDEKNCASEFGDLKM